jgi:mono/diheme cytochrome c family protein
MTGRNFGMSIMMMGSALILSGGMAFAEDDPPLPPIPAEYADKHMPPGGWTDPKAIEEGGIIYTGEANPQVNCGSCHGKDGAPVKKGARDLRDPKNVGRFSDSFWFWRIAEGIPKTKMKAWKSMLSEEQIWQVMAYEHQFSHGGKPSEHTDYKPAK